MNLLQTQIQEQVPKSLENMMVVMADLFLDYYANHTSEIVQATALLRRYESFPELIGQAFLSGFRAAVEEDAGKRGYELDRGGE